MIFDKVWKLVVSVLVTSTLIGVITYFVTREPKREMTRLMYDLAGTASFEFAEKLPRDRDVDKVLFIVATRGHRDEEQQFRDMITDAVLSTSKYRLRTWKQVKDDLNETILGQVLQKLGMTTTDGPDSLERAVKVMNELKYANIEVDGILIADVTDFNEGPERDGLGARIAVEGHLWSMKAGKEVGEPTMVRHEILSATDLRYVRYRISETSIILRLVLWFAISAITPWALITLVRAVVKSRKNELNAALLAGFTLWDLALFWAVVLALGVGWGALVALLVVAGLMAYYNYDAVDYIGRRLL